MVQPDATIVSGDMTALFALANGKGSLAGDYGTQGKWLGELNRLRSDLFGLKNGDGSYKFHASAAAAVSGAWNYGVGKYLWNPINGLGLDNRYFQSQQFLFDSDSETVTIGGNIGGLARGQYVQASYQVCGGIGFNNGPIAIFNPKVVSTQRTCTFIVGGDQTTVGADFFFEAEWIPGYDIDRTVTPNVISNYDNTDPTGLMTVQHNIPGATVQNYSYADDHDYPGQHRKIVACVISVNGVVPAGRYDLVFTVPLPPNETAGHVSSFLNMDYDSGKGALFASDSDSWNDDAPGGSGTGFCGETFTAAATVAAIHATEAVQSIAFTSHYPTLSWCNYPNITFDGNNQYVTSWGAEQVGQEIGFNISASRFGIWGGKTYPVTELNPGSFISNGRGVQSSADYCNPSQGYAITLINQTPRIVLGEQGLDSNGNLVTCIRGGTMDEFGNPPPYYDALFYYRNYSPGATAWPTKLGGTFPDFTALAAYGAVDDGTSAIWQLTNILNIYKLPAPWRPGVAIAAGAKILDGNGNTQTAGNAGTTMQTDGMTSPAWATNLGETTDDNGITWTLTAKNPPTMNRGNSRLNAIPPYPVVWDSDIWQAVTKVYIGKKIRDTNGEIRICTQAGVTGLTQPDWTTGGGIQYDSEGVPAGNVGNAADIKDGTAQWSFYAPQAVFNQHGGVYGKTIYKLAINRLATPNMSGQDAGEGNAPDAAIAVTVGFYRNGAFVALGTYQTGTRPIVNWPVFTATPLVYQCTERVDVQAICIQPTIIGFTGETGAVSMPLAAAYYNDTEAILNLL